MPVTVRDHLGGRIPPGWTPAPCVELDNEPWDEGFDVPWRTDISDWPVDQARTANLARNDVQVPVDVSTPRSRPPTLKDKLMSRYSPKNILEQEPAVISGAVIVAVNALALFGVVAVSAEQLAGLNAGLAALLALFTRQTVTPTAKVR